MDEKDRMNLYWKYVAEQNADQLDEYWGDDGEIPEWRLNMKLGRPII